MVSKPLYVLEMILAAALLKTTCPPTADNVISAYS